MYQVNTGLFSIQKLIFFKNKFYIYSFLFNNMLYYFHGFMETFYMRTKEAGRGLTKADRNAMKPQNIIKQDFTVDTRRENS